MNARQATRQQGVALIVALILLVIIALLGVSAVSNSTSNLRATSNTQSALDAEAAANDAVEQIVDNEANFENPATSSYTVDNFSVSAPKPECLVTELAEGYSALFILSPQKTVWRVSATSTDTLTGAKATVNQGVVLLLPSGLCPDP